MVEGSGAFFQKSAFFCLYEKITILAATKDCILKQNTMTENVQYTIKRCEQIQRDVENLILLRRNLDKAILRIELTDMCDESTFFTFSNPYFADDLKQRLLASMVDAAIDQLRKEYLALNSIFE